MSLKAWYLNAKVYQMNEFDWVAALSAKEAAEFYSKEFSEECINPVEQDLDKVIRTEDDGTKITLREALIKDKKTGPYVIASTEY